MNLIFRSKKIGAGVTIETIRERRLE